jgi:hypothetical protein
MNDLLMGIALILMFVSILVASNSKVPEEASKGTRATESKSAFLHKAFGLGGIAIACGGYWIDWLLWFGLILIEFGCIAYYVGKGQPNSRMKKARLPEKT